MKYQSPAVGQVTREYVAQKIVELAEDPQHSLYLGRLYDLPVTLNRVVPSLIDRVSAYWVRSKRKKELAGAPANSVLKEQHFGWLPWAFLPFGILFLRALLRRKVRS
ncbi:MAG: hypothetical protein QM730_24140 [Anaerolineales bacterium]